MYACAEKQPFTVVIAYTVIVLSCYLFIYIFFEGLVIAQSTAQGHLGALKVSPFGIALEKNGK